MAIAPGTQVVLELFDRPGGFTAEDQQVAGAAAELGVELLRQALGQRQTHQLLFDAVAAALKASEAMLAGKADAPPVLDQLRAGLQARKEDPAATEESVRLAEAIHLLGTKYGTPALEHCRRLVEEVQVLLDRATGTS